MNRGCHMGSGVKSDVRICRFGRFPTAGQAFTALLTATVAICLAMGPAMAQQTSNFSKSFMLIVNKETKEKKVVDVSKPDATLIVPSRMDAHGLSVDAQENLYITYKTDLSMPDAKVVGQGTSFSGGILALPTIDLTNNGPSFMGGLTINKVGTRIEDVIDNLGTSFNVIYAAEVGTISLPASTVDVGTPAAFDWGRGAFSQPSYNPSFGPQNLILINFLEKAVFALVDCDPTASWHAWDGDKHSYQTHMGHLGEHPAYDESGTLSPYCYPHTYQTATNADDTGMDGGSTNGSAAGSQAEPYGQLISNPDWKQPTAIPNGAWWHAKHSTQAGRGNYAEVRRRQYWPIFMNVLLEKHKRSDPAVQGDPPVYDPEGLPGSNAPNGGINFYQYGFNACEWRYPQCADSCYDVSGGNPQPPPRYARNPYQIVVGPSGRVYKYAAYRPPGDTLIQILDPASTVGWQNLNLSPEPDWVVNVDCGTDVENNVNSIGVATKSLTDDWLYLSSSPTFAVGDQFDGQGGICYVMKKQTDAAGNEISRSIEKIKYQGKTPFPGGTVDLGPTIDPVSVDAIAADGIGQLYFTTRNSSGAGNNWSLVDTPTFDDRTIDTFDTTLNPGKFTALNVPLKKNASIDLHHIELRTSLVQKDQAVGSGAIQSNGTVIASRVKDPSDPTNANVKNSDYIDQLIPESEAGNVNMNAIHVALATVVGATPPINGKINVDIVGPGPDANAPSPTDKGVDVISVEDLEDSGSGSLAWIAENWETNYNFTDPGASVIYGSPVDLNNPNLSEFLYKNSPWSDASHKNAYHYNWYNADDRAFGNPNFSADINANGFIGGWSSHIVGDGTNTGNCPAEADTAGPWKSSAHAPTHDTRAWRWAVYLTHTVEKGTDANGDPTYAMVALEKPELVYGYDILGYMSGLPEEQAKVSPDGWLSVKQKGYELRLGETGKYASNGTDSVGGPFKLKGSGVYDVMLQAKCVVYNYKAAKIGPEFMKDPNWYLPMTADSATMPGYPVFADGGGAVIQSYGNVDGAATLTGFMGIMAKAPDSAHGDNDRYPPASTDGKWIVAKRRVYVGEKTPDVGSWANMVLFARNPYAGDASFVMGPFNSGVDADHADSRVIQSDEDEVVEFQALAAVKYTLDLNEWVQRRGALQVWDPLSYIMPDGTLSPFDKPGGNPQTEMPDTIDISTGTTGAGKVSYDDAAAKFHDLFSGVVPGTVSFEWTYYNEDGTKTVTTTASAASPWDKVAETPPSYPADTKDVINPVEVLVRPDWGTSNIIARSNFTYAQDYGNSTLDFQFDVKAESGNLVEAGAAQKRLINILGGGSNLAWTEGGPLTTGWQEYVPNGSAVALFYFDKRIDDATPGLQPPQPLAQDTEVADPQDYYGLRHHFIYKTPSVGKPPRAIGDQKYPPASGPSYGNKLNAYRVRVVMKGTVREYLPDSPAVLQKAIDDVYANPLTNPASGVNVIANLAQAFKYTDHPAQVLVERFVNVVVHDRTAPIVTMTIPNKETGATTGDFFSNEITVEMRDNNPYLCPEVSGLGAFGRLWEKGVEPLDGGATMANARGTGRFDARLAWHSAPRGNGLEGPDKTVPHFWADIPMIEPVALGSPAPTDDVWCDLRQWLAGTDQTCKPELMDPSKPLESYSRLVYTFPADRWQMNADGHSPGNKEADITVFVSGVDGSGNGELVMLNSPSDTVPEPAIPNESADVKSYRGPNQEGDGNLTRDVDLTQGVGIDARPCRKDDSVSTVFPGGSSYDMALIPLFDNDPPEVRVDVDYFLEGNAGSFTHIVSYGENQENASNRPKIGDANHVEAWRMHPANDKQDRPEFITQAIKAKYPPNLVDLTAPDGRIAAASLGDATCGKLYLDFIYSSNQKMKTLVEDRYLKESLIAGADPADLDCDANPDGVDPVPAAWEVNTITATAADYFIETMLPDVGAVTSPPFSTRSYIPIPEDTRVKFSVRSQDNVDGIYDLTSTGSDAIFKSVTRFNPDSSIPGIEGMVVFAADPATGVPDPNITPTVASVTGIPTDKVVGFHHHNREPTPDTKPNTEWIITLTDKSGNIRAIVLPLRVVDTRVNVHALERPGR